MRGLKQMLRAEEELRRLPLGFHASLPPPPKSRGVVIVIFTLVCWFMFFYGMLAVVERIVK